MNNKKKIIESLRKADKASVEKLMAEEAKKNEIYAKVRERVNAGQTEFASSASGVEKYERRISMTRIASVAAAVAIIAGSIGGGAYVMRNKPDDRDAASEHFVAASTESETTSFAEETTAATTIASEPETIAVTTEPADDTQDFGVTKEELIEKAKDDNSVKYFDKFSADYTYTLYQPGEFRLEPETYTGQVFLDEVNLTASGSKETRVNDKLVNKLLCVIKDDVCCYREENWAELDFKNGGYKFFETPEVVYNSDENTCAVEGKVCISRIPCGRNVAIDVNAPENWEITDVRTENGRKIVSISGLQKGDNNYEGVYRELPYTGEIDAETGMTLSFDLYDGEGNLSYSYKVANYKFDDEAEAFRTPEDILSEIGNKS